MNTQLARMLYVTVFLTGAAVLVFEVAAVRLLSPYYGSSLYVLSSVLTTVLLALSLGYYWGGRLADRYPEIPVLLAVISCGGAVMTALVTASLYVLPVLAPTLGIATGPLVIALLFFFVPAFLLGIDSPFVIKVLGTSQTGTEGAVVGSVFFWSTIGSIVGSLAAGFWLIPYVGLVTTLLFTGLVVSLWAGVVLLFIRSRKAVVRPLAVYILGTAVVVALLMTGLGLRTNPTAPGTLLYYRDGLYGSITVFENTIGTTTYRFLKHGNNHSSAIIPGSTTVVFPYAQYTLLYDTLVPEVENILVLGGGAFTMPRHIHAKNPDTMVDTIELEPFLEDLSYEYFELPRHENIRNHTVDARVYLTSTTTMYDVILSDVMNTGHFIPPHLATAEFYELVKARLRPQGVAFFNYIGSLDTNGLTLTGSTIKTIASVFPNYEIVAVTDRGSFRIQNILIIVRNGETPITLPKDTVITIPQTGATSTPSRHLVYHDTLKLDDEVIFTDERAPIEPLLFKQFRTYGR